MAPLKEAVERWRSEFLAQRAKQSIPNFTCPLIDGVLRTLEDGACSCHGLVEDHMETIRRANDGLRDLGRDWYEFARDMLDDLEMTIKLAERSKAA